ncbi:putative polyketide synthase [Zopfia rhizophila CBS 207.26]|uniref:Putative polyketide synthase n=1 Tax=Zopfia rhizophila CBS 207.26 TaxID=1314779 RepID=A0A6A6DFK4_9PEZI|nr:putative polyketide synthase [Zopfia rhizophila CBS 207.26]
MALPGDEPVMPIAIVGLAGRYPGDASNPERLWDLIAEKRSAMTEVPKDRFTIDSYYHPYHERHNSVNVRGAHFMQHQDVSSFDAPFFSINPNEAKAMDPQQRMALECSYEALENGGIRIEDIVGSDTSCYVGSFTRDYPEIAGNDAENVPSYHGVGSGDAILSNRLSWFYDLRGPSISIDTACSSSLVALHLGCQSLRTGESKMSIVGGTNLILMSNIMSAMSNLHFLSPDSKSHSFDHRANGYARGEGVSFVVLKPLELALRDNDMIRAVIRNTSVNQDGNTPGITVPSAESQKNLIRQCYANAGLDLASTQFVEAHGTGTPTGDPLEASALAQTFGAARPAGQPLLIGSVKSNIGHLEGASGVAQVTKAIMALEKGMIPPNIWFEKANPRIPMEEWNLQVPTKLQEWPTQGQRRISINSFGYGGTNAHAILDDAYHYLKARGLRGRHQTTGGNETPASEDSGIDSGTALGRSPRLDSAQWPAEEESGALKLFTWSSSEKPGLQRLADMYKRYVASKMTSLTEKDEAQFLEQLSYTLSSKRSSLPWKSFVIASSPKELVRRLEDAQIEQARSSDAIPKIAFVFTGQGAQWHAMGRELLSNSTFRSSITAADAYLQSIGCSWSLYEELCQDEQNSQLQEPEISQPACTALQIALVDLLRQWGILPQAVVGHSSGEIAAAYAAGGLTREAAWCIAYHRGRLSSQLKKSSMVPGGMLATNVGAVEAQAYLNRVSEGQATVACINSPSSITLSGDKSAILELERLLSEDGHFARRLKVDAAYHSHHMQAIATEYREALQGITPAENTGTVQMFSSLQGELVDVATLGADYWVANLTGRVNFNGAVEQLCQHSSLFVEIGPHAALKGPLMQICKQFKLKNVNYASALIRGSDASVSTLEMAGKLLLSGIPVDIARVNNINEEMIDFLVDIEPYPWNHANKYWCESRWTRNQRLRKHPRLDLLGGQTYEEVTQQPRWRNILRLNEMPWMEAHQVQGSVLYPAAGMLIMAIEGMKQIADTSREIDGYELRDVTIGKAIVVDRSESGTETMLCIQPRRMGTKADTAAWEEFCIYSLNGDAWSRHCSGLIRIRYKSTPSTLFPDERAIAIEKYRQQYAKVLSECVNSRNIRTFYEHLESIGLHYGPLFQNLIQVYKGEYQTVCTLRIPDTKSQMPAQFEFPHVIHPATLDNIVQMCIPAATRLAEELTTAQVPTFVGNLFVSADVPSAPGSLLQGYSVAKNVGFDASVDVVVSVDGWEKPLVVFEQLKSTPLRTMELEGTINTSLIRKPVSYIQWDKDHTMLDPAAIKESCRAATKHLQKVDPFKIGELELVCFIYMKRILNHFTAEEAKAFTPHLHKFYEFMQRTYDQVERGEFQSQLRLVETDWLNTDEAFENELIERVSSSSADGALVRHHGEHLSSIFRGDEIAIQVLMQDDRLSKLYQDGVGCHSINKQLAEYVNLMAHKSPDMKILEIGAGTGGTALRVLEKLGGENGTAPRFGRYDYTDISTGFFDKAATKFKSWARRMNFAKLNIEQDPLAQGFQEGEYDLVIAANVLHATKFLGQTLQNVRKLMKPGAKLVLMEITNTRLRTYMTVGSLSGWWLGADDDREWAPTIGVDDWNKRLQGAGFGGVDVTMSDFEDPRDQMYSFIAATAGEEAAAEMPSDVVFVVPESQQAVSFAATLKDRLVKTTSLSLQEASEQDLSAKSVIFLLDCDPDRPMLADISPADWESLKKVILNAEYSMWVSRGGTIGGANPFANLMTGLSRSIRGENPSLQLMTVDLDLAEDLASESNVTGIEKVLASARKAKTDARPEWEFAIRDGQLHVQRLQLEQGMNTMLLNMNAAPQPRPAPLHQAGRPMNMGVGIPGRLDTLQFADDTAYKPTLGHDDVEIQVKSVGLNFKDLMISMGQLQEPELGFECSGVVSRVGATVSNIKPGDRVMTFKVGCFRNFVTTPSSMAIPMPAGVDFETAASLPLVYGTAYYALYEKAHLDLGQTVLIHSAAGGVGQAAIMLAQRVGAEIFATVSSAAKKSLLMDKYNIPEDHIFNSRDTSFAKGVMRMTNGCGVDVVLNSLNAEHMRESWYCTARFGQFVELGQKDIVGNTGIEMSPMINNISFHSVNLIAILEHDTPRMSRILHTVMQLFGRNIIKPVDPVKALPMTRVEEAFRLMQGGQHIGKLVLNFEADSVVPVIPASSKPATFRPDATYVLAGGFGGVGRSIAQWMIQQGAQNLLFLSRSGAAKPEAKKALDRFASQGVKVAACACDISNLDGVKSALEAAKDMPPIRGLIQASMVLEDAPYERMSHAQYMAAVRPKVQGTWNLHQLLPQDLDFFVMLSSSASIVSSRAQSNYAAGNAFQDALAFYRRARGQQACAIDLGIILGVGFLEENNSSTVTANIKSWNFTGIKEQEMHRMINSAITGSSMPDMPRIPAQFITGLPTGAMITAARQKFPWWSNDAKFAHLRDVDSDALNVSADEEAVQLQALLGAAESLAGAVDVVADAIVNKLAKSMMVDVQDVEKTQTISKYGVDSLLAVELRSWIYTELQVDISIFELLKNVPIQELAGTIALKSKLTPAALVREEAT